MRHLSAAIVIACFVSFSGCGTEPVPAIKPPPAKVAADPVPDTNIVKPAPPKSRQFTFHYKFRVKDLKATGDAEQDLVRVWMPRPSTSEHQQISRLPEVAPVTGEDFQEARYGNQLRYLQLPIPANGEFSVDLPYEVVRQEVQLPAKPGDGVAEIEDKLRSQLLAADQLVPTTGKPLELLKDAKLADDSFARARQLYDVVDAHVVYKKEGTGWGRGDTNWVCDNGYGNCTDFHSLFISLARSQGLPAQFEIGFSIPTDKTAGPIAGYHCWAWFFEEKRGWIPVDISEADKNPALKDYYFGNLTVDRVMFSVGRDLQLQPPPAQGPTNFLIYPYIEVGGKPLPKENLELQFSFKDK